MGITLVRNEVRKQGAYCMRSMQKSPGYVRKVEWTEKQASAGLNYLQLKRGKKTLGFIEYAPGEQAWRVVHADGYLVIHCLWVGETGSGLGTDLIRHCIEDARQQGKRGVAVLTSTDSGWAPDPAIFVKNGFAPADQALDLFGLYVYPLCGDAEMQKSPARFPGNWRERLDMYPDGLTVLRTDQCPYLEIATHNLLSAARSIGIEPNIIDIETRERMMELAPSPYGVFNVVYRGELISYHRMTPKGFLKRISEIDRQQSKQAP